MVILPSRFSVSSFSATENVSVEVFIARVPSYFIHFFADSSMAYSKSIFALTSIFTSPPNDVTSNFEDVTVSASFCFCETAIVFDAVPALMRTDALRSSGVSLSFALIVIDASPAVPLWGVTLNQPSARSFTISAIQSAVAENEILSSSANSSNETEDLLSVIVGVVGVLPPPLSEPLSAGSLFEQATIDTTVSK